MNEQTNNWQADFHNWHRRFWSEKKFAPAALDVINWIRQNQSSIAVDVAKKKERELELKQQEIEVLKIEMNRLRERKPFIERLKALFEK